MMMTHRIVLKTHPLLTTHVRSVHSILFQEWVSKRRSDCKRVTEESQRVADSGMICLVELDSYRGG